MVPVILGDEVRIPGGIEDLEAFRRWAKSDEFPERGRFAFLGDDLWVDLAMEDRRGLLQAIGVDDKLGLRGRIHFN